MNIKTRAISSLAKGEILVVLASKGKAFFELDSKLGIERIKDVNNALAAFEKGILSGCEVLSSGTLVVDCGEAKGLDKLEAIRLVAYSAGKIVRTRAISKASLCLGEINEPGLAAVCEGLLFSDYDFDAYKSEKKKKPITNWGLSLDLPASTAKNVLNTAQKVMSAVRLTRDLVNVPGGDMRPQEMVQQARKVAQSAGLKIKVRNAAQLKKEKFGGLLAVGRGGNNPPQMVTLTYTPKKVSKEAKGKHIVLVGKGVTFDTGGLSLKPSASMWEMRHDMGGSATVLGAIEAIAALKLPIKVSAVLCLTENRPGQDAILPGDIFTAKNGKTIMVENTDAEGRLVLTDGLAEAGLLKGTHIIDLATLTGAIVRALGTCTTGLFSNDDSLAGLVDASAKQVGEKCWRLPLEEEYRSSLDDKVADLKNIGGDAGSITAALFLQEFVPENTPWVHLDIAGTSFNTKSWTYHGWGATGWGVRTLVETARNMS